MKFFVLFFAFLPWLVAQPATEPPVGNKSIDFETHLAISKEEYRQRRQALREKLPDHPVVLMGNILRNRINDTDYEFRQESNFLYLTGYEEPNAFLVISKKPFTYQGTETDEILFVRENNPVAMTWVGKRLGSRGAMDQLGIKLAVAISEPMDFRGTGKNYFETFMKSFVETHPSFILHTPIIRYHQFGTARPSYFEHYKQSLISTLAPVALDDGSEEQPPPIEILEPGKFLNAMRDLRGVKSERELEMLQRAVDVTLSGHRESFKIAKDVRFEYQVEAAIEYAFKFNGAEAVGYNSIVGCGPNGTILHYDTNREGFSQEQIFCLDAGAEYRGYTADITRSFPADGTFSKPQREVYEIVLAAQKAGEEAFKPGANYASVKQVIDEVLKEGLLKRGIIQEGKMKRNLADLQGHPMIWGISLAEDVVSDGKTIATKNTTVDPALVTKLLESGIKTVMVDDQSQFKQVCPHGWGHPVGLDVHDLGSRGPFEAGMVWTIEPGIYISDRINFPVDPKYMNIGIRIEDMYVITEKGNRRMSAGLPREVEEIETFMKNPSNLVLFQKHGHSH